MPKGRMLLKKISQDEKVAKLSLPATLLYTWCIPNLDVKGRLHGDQWSLKAIVPHIDELTPQKIDKCVEEFISAGLVVSYGDKQRFLQFNGFLRNQKVYEDKEAESVIPDVTPDQLQSKDRVTPEQVKESKVKESKVKERSARAIFDYFCLKTKKQLKLTPDRENLIKKKLNEGYTVEQIKTAITNFSQDDWADRPKYCDLIYCIGQQKGKADNMERWLNVESKTKPKWMR